MSLVSSVSLLISWLIQQIMDCMTNTDMRTLASCGVIAIGILGLYAERHLSVEKTARICLAANVSESALRGRSFGKHRSFWRMKRPLLWMRRQQMQ